MEKTQIMVYSFKKRIHFKLDVSVRLWLKHIREYFGLHF